MHDDSTPSPAEAAADADPAELLSKAQTAYRAGELTAAEAAYRALLTLMPDSPQALSGLSMICHSRGDPAGAVGWAERLVALAPTAAEANFLYGFMLRAAGRLEAAATAYRKTMDLKPDYVEAYNNLGNTLRALGRSRPAEVVFREALRIAPRHATAHNNLGNVLRAQGRLAEAETAYRTAAELAPDDVQIASNLCHVLMDRGETADVIPAYRRLLVTHPDNPKVHSNLLMAMNYDWNGSPEVVYREHLAWAARHAEPLAVGDVVHANETDSERPLKVGYISADFRTQSVAFFMEPILAGHDATAFETWCYADVASPDETTQRLRAHATGWRDVVGWSDARVADQARADGIDILVDLGGHTGNNRLLVFARHPAPVQVTYLGYPNTTGLAAMDYRLTDRWADPPGESDRLSTETLVRLPHGFHCYRPPPDAPDVGPLPARAASYITFGSFNNLAKMSPQLIRVWSEILRAAPGSRLLMKSKSLGDHATRHRYRTHFAAEGIAEERLELLGHSGTIAEHLRLYARIDVGLDTYPYNGTTTTCEALWMGVPVLTLAGRAHAGRVGASLLRNLGLDSFVADTEAGYIDRATALAADVDTLAAMRAALRGRLTNASLTDQIGFVRALETAYRTMWRSWCAGQSGEVPGFE